MPGNGMDFQIAFKLKCNQQPSKDTIPIYFRFRVAFHFVERGCETQFSLRKIVPWKETFGNLVLEMSKNYVKKTNLTSKEI